MTYLNDERRRFPRTSHTYTISFKKCNESNVNWDISNTRNLSLSGAQFLSSEPFPQESLLNVLLRVPTENIQCSCKAKVQRCEGPFNKVFYKIAVCFTEIDPEHVVRVRRSIDFFLSKDKIA